MTDRIDRRSALVMAASAILATAMTSAPKMAVMTGTVFYRERMALPPGAVVEVTLADVSLADAPAKIIAQTKVASGPGTPTRWTLEYQAALIEPGRSYALQARIVAGDMLLFISDERHEVLGGGEDNTDLLVRRVAGDAVPPAAAASPAGAWLVEDIAGAGADAAVISSLTIAADGTLSGQGGCNRFAGYATIAGDTIAFGQISSTMMACAPLAMQQERKFLAALGAVRRFKLEGTPTSLVLTDEAGKTVLVLGAM